MNITEEQFQKLIAMLAQIETTGRVNFVPVLGLAGAEEAFFIMQEFIANLEKQALAKEKTLAALHSENKRLGLYKDAYAQSEQEPVAWMYQEYRHDDQFGWRDEIQFVQPPNDPNYFRNIVPVYTTPPQRTWVGLTLDEIALIHANYSNPQGFALALQAKLKELNT
jgi:hypothetical protein